MPLDEEAAQHEEQRYSAEPERSRNDISDAVEYVVSRVMANHDEKDRDPARRVKAGKPHMQRWGSLHWA